MKKLGFGLMRMPSLDPNDASKVDIQQVQQMVDLFLEKGFTYFDTAWMYNAFASESTAKTVLVDRHPRESFTLATKLHTGFFNSLEDRDKIFNAQLEKTGAGYFDYYLLHGIEAGFLPKFEELDCFHWLLDKREKGLVRHANSEMLEALVPFKGVQVKCSSTVKSAQPGQVVIAGEQGEETLPADSVILCVGYKAENSLYEELKDQVDAIYQIGDANKVANIMYAIWDAYEVASTL